MERIKSKKEGRKEKRGVRKKEKGSEAKKRRERKEKIIAYYIKRLPQKHLEEAKVIIVLESKIIS